MSIRTPVVAVCAAAVLTLAGCVNPGHRTSANTIAANQAVAAKPGTETCDTTTGSRLQRKNSDCSPSTSAARSYSAKDLEGTGQTDLAEAMRQVDPAPR